jgi:hypothetical protein
VVASARGVPIDQALNPKVQDSGAAKEIPSILAAANPTLEYASAVVLAPNGVE